MPTSLRIGGFRFHFYSDEFNEPPHIHVRNADGECKYWLDPVVLAWNRGVRAHDLRRVNRLVHDNREMLITKFHEYHDRKV